MNEKFDSFVHMPLYREQNKKHQKHINITAIYNTENVLSGKCCSFYNQVKTKT